MQSKKFKTEILNICRKKKKIKGKNFQNQLKTDTLTLRVTCALNMS